MTATLLANLLLLASDLVAIRLLRRGGPAAWGAPLVGPAVILAWHLVATLAGHGSFFFLTQLLAWWGFVHLPVVLLFGSRRRAPAALVAGAIGLVGLDAFVWEPRWLEVSTFAAEGPPLRIALLADIQTDHVGAYEEAVFAEVRAARPDLVLFAGDYIQLDDPVARAREGAKLRALIATLDPPLGGFAVRGDVDASDWTSLFEGTAITPLDATRTVSVGPLTLTGLAIRDSRRTDLDLPRVEGLHVVLGHAPDFVLGTGRRDLNLAGHTHGGQVRIPLFGPLLTLSDVPRDAAAGPTRLDDGSWLYVSRGIGMERDDAPRLRFNCRPELVLVELGTPIASAL